jgi:predicted transcriptional regulator
MPINTETLNSKLYHLLSKYDPKPLDSDGKVTPLEDEADVFKFEFTKDGESYGDVFATVDDDRKIVLYYKDDVTQSPDSPTPGIGYNDTWWGFLEQIAKFWPREGFSGRVLKDTDKLGSDMARRKHMKNKDQLGEGYYPMGKSRSYSDAVPSVKIVIEHSRVIEEGEQRYRNINRIFLENQDGERYLLDTKKPGIARVYARHIAEGGKVNDDRWNHVHSLCEEYSKMAGFVRATRNGQFNESAQSLVNEGIAHYQSLRESLSRMTGKRGYNAYFESWTPALMEDEGDETNLNELFVQETLDPRIESVMPILNRIHKKVSESVVDKEMNKLAEWADSLVEEESLTSNYPVGIPESEGQKEIGQMMADDGITYSAEKENEIIGKMVEYMKKSGMDSKKIRYLLNYDEDYIADQLSYLSKEGMEESALQASFGDEKYTRKGMDALRKAGREHAGKEKMQNIRAKFSSKEDPVTEVDTGQYDAAKSPHKGETTPEQEKSFREKVQAYSKELEQRQKEKEVDEGLDANQKRVGQLGPTEKVKNNNIGKLVGTNENFINTVDQAVTTEDEMDEGEHTQHAMRGRNPGANEFEHDFEPEDKIGNIHDKISRMLKRLEKPKDKEPNMKDTDLGNTVLESEERPYVCVHAKKGKCEVKASSSYQAAQKAAQKWGLKGTAGIDAHLADVKKDTSSLEESTDELARILTIMNHRR